MLCQTLKVSSRIVLATLEPVNRKKINLRSVSNDDNTPTMIRRRHGEAAGPIGAANLARRCARPGIVEIDRV